MIHTMEDFCKQLDIPVEDPFDLDDVNEVLIRKYGVQIWVVSRILGRTSSDFIFLGRLSDRGTIHAIRIVVYYAEDCSIRRTLRAPFTAETFKKESGQLLSELDEDYFNGYVT